MMWIKRITGLALVLFLMVACSTAHTLSEEGRRFTYQNNGIVIGKTMKRDIVSAYGNPNKTDIRGKYEIMTYSYAKESFKTGGVGSALLGAVPGVGLIQAGVELSKDQGKDDTIREWQNLTFYVDLGSGIVRDYVYRDSNLNGHNESETLLLKSMVAFNEKKNDEGISLLEKSIEKDPENHRALNNLAWNLIDLGTDVDKGINHASKAVEVFPDSPYNNGTLGVGYFKKGDYEKAEKYLKTAVELYPIYAPGDMKGLQRDKAMLDLASKQKNAQIMP